MVCSARVAAAELLIASVGPVDEGEDARARCIVAWGKAARRSARCEAGSRVYLADQVRGGRGGIFKGLLLTIDVERDGGAYQQVMECLW